MKKDFIFNEINKIKGVGPQLSKYLKKRRIEKIKDIILNLPYSETDRSKIYKLNELEVGKIQSIRVKVKKLNFPRIRNLPNKIICEDETGKIDIVYFNSREGYLRKLFPINSWIIISGKVNYFNKKYQITNPDYVTKLENQDYVVKSIPKYNLTKGINEKKYRSISEQIIKNIPIIDDWLNKNFIDENNLMGWNESITKLHNSKDSQDNNSSSFRRIVFDELCANFLILSENRKSIKKKKISKKFDKKYSDTIIKKLPFELTNSQKVVLDEINEDLMSENRMFRIIQGDVGSGKTIVSLLAIVNVLKSGYQCALMGPTEILAKQHFELSKKVLKIKDIKIEFLTGKTDYKDRKKILTNIANGKTNLLIGTHALFQKKINFKKLGLVVIDEQHKFGVKQRSELAKKGGNECDVLLMSATPIPRTMMMSLYGDMDISKINEKPSKRKKIITLSKPEKKINELWPFIKKQIEIGNQVFWVCPLIEKSAFLDYSSAKKKFEIIENKFKNKVGLIHGNLEKNEKQRILKNSDDGFFIAEEDLKLRGFGDLIGYQQSGIKNFRFADPVNHEDLFELAEKYVKNISREVNEKKYSFLLKLFDKAEIININEI